MESGFLSEKKRKDTIREAKLAQERAYYENLKLERMSKKDPSYEFQQEKMIAIAQDCGRNYGKWLKAQGRKIILRENNG